LKEKGLIEFVERKRDWHGRFSAYLYRVVHIAAAAIRKGAAAAVTAPKGRGRRRKTSATTVHEGRMATNKGLTKRHEDPLPLKKTELLAIGGSLAKIHRPVLTSNIVKKSTKGRNRRPAAAEKDSTGCSSRPPSTRCNERERELTPSRLTGSFMKGSGTKKRWKGECGC
jgi:hypothetical protein